MKYREGEEHARLHKQIPQKQAIISCLYDSKGKKHIKSFVSEAVLP